MESTRIAFSAEIAASSGVSKDAVLEAFSVVPREKYLAPGPWWIRLTSGLYVRTPDAQFKHVLHNVVVRRDDDTHCTSPALTAFCLNALHVPCGGRACLIGRDVRYEAALLAHCLGPTGALDVRDESMSDGRHIDSSWPAQDSMDVVWLLLGCSRPPMHLLLALKPGGRLIFPLLGPSGNAWFWLVSKPSCGDDRAWSACLMFEEEAAPWPSRWLLDEASLAESVSAGFEQVNAIRLGDNDHGHTILCGDGWCLSSRGMES